MKEYRHTQSPGEFSMLNSGLKPLYCGLQNSHTLISWIQKKQNNRTNDSPCNSIVRSFRFVHNRPQFRHRFHQVNFINRLLNMALVANENRIINKYLKWIILLLFLPIALLSESELFSQFQDSSLQLLCNSLWREKVWKKEYFNSASSNYKVN